MAVDYESSLLRDWYVAFHYGQPSDILKHSAFTAQDLPAGCLDFPRATVAFFGQQVAVDRALDVGCAVGGSSYAMSRIARQVVGIDFSRFFVETARAIGAGQPYSYRLYAEAHLSEPATATLPPDCRPERVAFETGDAMNLRRDLGQFDLVHAANLLCRLAEPERFLERLPGLVKKGGKLVMATPATWMPDFTAPERMPPGETLAFLAGKLHGEFELADTREIPFLMREHQRKFQLSTSQASLWVRR